MAEGLRNAYKELYDRSEYVHDLPKEKLRNLVVEMTGLKASDPSVSAIVGTFTNLRAYTKYDGGTVSEDSKNLTVIKKAEDLPPPPAKTASQNTAGLNLSYTINLNLPETTDVEVFNAIFRSLKENLLKV